MLELQVDRHRAIDPQWKEATGIYVRAWVDGRMGPHDIAVLTQASLLKWLRSRGGQNRWAEGLVASLLGHEPDPEPVPLEDSIEEEVYRATFEELTPDAQTELLLRHLRDLLDVPAEGPLSKVAWTLFQWLERKPS